MTETIARPAGVVLPNVLLPGSPEWQKKISASKVSALLGLSTYESRFSLWHRMQGLVPWEADDDVKRRGHYLEPAIAAWFADQHLDWEVQPTGTWQHRLRDWQTASPDRLIVKPGADVALLECKSANGAEGDDWGESGTNEIPPGVLAQCLWQLDVTGYDTCHVAVIGPFLEFAEYVVERDERDMAFMRERALEFLGTLERNERPDIDEHGATYLAVRELHPLIDPVNVDLPADLARGYCRAKHAVKTAEAEAQLQTSRVADLLGTGKNARFDGQTIARRQAKGDGLPYIVAGRNLPTFPEQEHQS